MLDAEENNSRDAILQQNCQKALDSLLASLPAEIITQLPQIKEAIKYEENIKKIAKKSKQDQKKAYDYFITFCNDIVVPELAKRIRQSNESLLAARKRLREMHLASLNKSSENTIIEKSFQLSSTSSSQSNKFISQQDFTFYLTERQFKQLNSDLDEKAKIEDEMKRDFRVCYDRGRPGLSAARYHTFGLSNSAQPILSYWHHSSPVPYHLNDFKKRIAITQENFQQLASNIIRKDDQKYSADKTGIITIPITELRLLSPLNKYLTPFDHEQKQYGQILETYMAALLVDGEKTNDHIKGKLVHFKVDMQMGVYGVNRFRAWHDPLQDIINTRFLNETFATLLPFPLEKHWNESLRAIEQQRKGLAENFRKKFKECATEKEAKQVFIKLLETHHRHEQELYEKSTTYLKDNQSHLTLAQRQNLQLIFKLLENKNWSKKEYNYQLQAALVVLNLPHREVATGCNDAKDRESAQAARIIAKLAFNHIHRRYADPFKETDRILLQTYEVEIYLKSSLRFAAEKASMPGAQHCELHASDGNEHLTHPLAPMGKMFKDMHKISTKAAIKNKFNFSAIKKGLVYLLAIFGLVAIATNSDLASASSTSVTANSSYSQISKIKIPDPKDPSVMAQPQVVDDPNNTDINSPPFKEEDGKEEKENDSKVKSVSFINPDNSTKITSSSYINLQKIIISVSSFLTPRLFVTQFAPPPISHPIVEMEPMPTSDGNLTELPGPTACA